jgi:C2 domain
MLMCLFLDPVVRLTLQLGQTDKVKRKKTCVKRNTLNPKWNEEISFNIPGISLAESCLEIGVYHHDLIAPDEPLGFLRFENTTSIGSANIAQHSEIIHWCEVINGGQRAACWHLLRKAARAVPTTSTSIEKFNVSRQMSFIRLVLSSLFSI